MSNEQVNVRVPTEARDAFLDLARMLRDDRKVLPRLRAFIREQSDPSAGSTTLSMRVEALEKDMAAVKRRLLTGAAPEAMTAAAAADEAQYDLEDRLGSRPKPAEQPTDWVDPLWYNGKEGRARRLSSLGEQEMDRRIMSGQSDTEIAKAMGCGTFTVANRKKRLGLQGPTGSFSQPASEPAEEPAGSPEEPAEHPSEG